MKELTKQAKPQNQTKSEHKDIATAINDETVSKVSSELENQMRYQSGFGNYFESEAETGALPVGQNSPQRSPLGLYAEQLSGSSFTASRSENLRSWLYRINPSVMHGKFSKLPHALLKGRPFDPALSTPTQLRWNPMQFPDQDVDFIDSLVTIVGNGDSASWRGSAVHLYAATKNMTDRFFYNADGELLFVPDSGSFHLRTEFGDVVVSPGEIAVVPRGIKFQVVLPDGKARGYICENFGPRFKLPDLGTDWLERFSKSAGFLTPTAAYENIVGIKQLVAKYNGSLWSAEMPHSPLNVVAWHGNYAPYKYDLAKFQAINTVSFDHCDPSIFTVLTSASEIAGYANVDFVIFPPRWMVAEKTFRPPYYHRNFMSEYMGLIFGTYDAKEEGFVQGGSSLHNCMSAHGPDAATFERASSAELKPVYQGNTLAFMFESSLPFTPTEFALQTPLLQPDYVDCWKDLKSHFELGG